MVRQRFDWLNFKTIRRYGIYSLLSVIVAMGIGLGTPLLSQAAPRWSDLLFQGIQILQISTISDRQEVELGQEINQQLLRRGEVRIYRDRGLSAYVNRVGQRLVPNSDRPNIPYTFQVVNDKSVNAFATMGGFVYVNLGLIQTADNEAQLASVISHEMGHIGSRHAIKQMREAAIAQGVAAAAGVNRNILVNIGVDLAITKPTSRQNEFEADEKGLVTLTRTGYAPGAMVDFMKKLLKLGGSTPAFLSTHPSTADRIVALEKAISPAKAYVGDGLDRQVYRNSIQALAAPQDLLASH
jgi:predicted Zn-dependent protease